MGIDEILEARFRHILEQDRWIPQTTNSVASEIASTTPLSGGGGGGDDSRKWIGCLLIGTAAVGLLAIWCRR